MVTWRFRAGQNAQIESELTEVIKTKSWVQPLEQAYVVKVVSTADYNAIVQRLVDIAKKYPSAFYLLISPPMTGGTYYGWLGANIWPMIQERTT